MVKCQVCDSSITDSAFCAGCNNHYGFCCASVTEAGYRKLGAERRAMWRCAKCKARLSPSPVPANPSEARDITVSASLDSILDEIRSIKLQLAGLPALIEEVRGIKNDIAEIKYSCEFNSACISDQSTKMLAIEAKVSEFQAVQSALDLANKEIASLKAESADREQRSRLNNVEIKGVPERKNENLYDVVDAISKRIGCDLEKTQINYIARVPIHNSKEKSIIVSIHNRYTKENFVAAARLHKTLRTSDFSKEDIGHRV